MRASGSIRTFGAFFFASLMSIGFSTSQVAAFALTSMPKPTAPTQTQGNNSTRIATTAYVDTLGTAKANAVHTHAISDVTSLQTTLDAKAAASHTHTASQITDATTAGRALLTAVDAATQRTSLGLGTGALRNVSVGTTAPASPAVNDLWVDTN